MNTETGRVQHITKHNTTIIINKGKKCIGCKYCISGDNGNYMIARAQTLPGIKEGDIVQISSREINQVKDGFLLFILPLIIIFTAFTLGKILVSVFFGIVFALISVSIPFIYFKLNRKKYQFTIKRKPPPVEVVHFYQFYFDLKALPSTFF